MTGGAWLTLVKLDPRSRVAGRDLRDVAAMHRRVMSLLPAGEYGDHPRATAGVLYRVQGPETPTPTLLVQTAIAADPSGLPAGYGTVQTRDMAPMLGALRPGMPVAYRILGNTVRREAKLLHKPQDNPLAGKLVALTRAEVAEWWESRAARCGLRLGAINVVDTGYLTGRRNGHKIGFATNQFTGRAVVTDADLLRSAVLGGVGHGKAYGCGLLSITASRPD